MLFSKHQVLGDLEWSNAVEEVGISSFNHKPLKIVIVTKNCFATLKVPKIHAHLKH